MKRIFVAFNHILIFYTIFISIWGVSDLFTDNLILPKWIFCMIGLTLFTLGYSIGALFNRIIDFKVSYIFHFIIAIASLQAFYGILQHMQSENIFSKQPITGCFDNPAGFASCLCFSLPFACTLLSSQKKYLRYIGLSSTTIIVIAIFLSLSRAGIITITAILFIWICKSKHLKNNAIKYVFTIIFSLIFAGCYLWKKDSADGRLFIWKCSLTLAKESPITGHGIGCFNREYMDTQAKYFHENGIDNKHAMLASNVNHPFNEYLNLFLNFGAIGLIILVCLMIWLHQCYKKNTGKMKKEASYALLSIGIFSFFSYPFNYPFTWLITFTCIALIANDSIKHIYKPLKVQYILGIVTLIFSLWNSVQLTMRINAEMEWDRAFESSFTKNMKNVLPKYKSLEQYFMENPYFLYNYAIILQNYGQHAKSLKIASLCNHYWGNYNLELIMGDNLTQLNNYKKAEKHYQQASLMCPSRFLPLYKLLQLYKQNGDKRLLRKTASAILSKPIKHKTGTIMMIKKEAERILNVTNQQ